MTDAPKLILTRGIPASGKSTWAKAWVSEDSDNRVRLNRDDLRAMLGTDPTKFSYQTETLVTHLQQEGARAALKAGKSVVIDDTNLKAKHVKEWFKVGPVEFRDFPIEPGEAMYRDGRREKSVGEDVIRSFAKRYVGKDGSLPAAPEPPSDNPLGVEPYVPDMTKPDAVIVDTDGTVAQMNGRGPYDGHLVHTDLPIPNVIETVRMFAANDVKIIAVSGRDAKYGEVTVKWWRAQGIPFDEFYFRLTDDKRRDDIVKLEIFNQHIRDRFNMLGVFDDRLRVCRMWYQLGLTTYRVGDPDADF